MSVLPPTQQLIIVIILPVLPQILKMCSYSEHSSKMGITTKFYFASTIIPSSLLVEKHYNTFFLRSPANIKLDIHQGLISKSMQHNKAKFRKR